MYRFILNLYLQDRLKRSPMCRRVKTLWRKGIPSVQLGVLGNGDLPHFTPDAFELGGSQAGRSVPAPWKRPCVGAHPGLALPLQLATTPLSLAPPACSGGHFFWCFLNQSPFSAKTGMFLATLPVFSRSQQHFCVCRGSTSPVRIDTIHSLLNLSTGVTLISQL